VRAIANKLLQEFKSVKNIAQKSQDELEKVIGIAKAKLVVEFYKTKTDSINCYPFFYMLEDFSIPKDHVQN
jgi:ERCC4-type nuclease